MPPVFTASISRGCLSSPISSSLSPENRRFSKETPSISFTPPLLSLPPPLPPPLGVESAYYVFPFGKILSRDRIVIVESKCFFFETFLVFFFFFFFCTKYSSSIHDEPCNETSCRFSRAPRQLYRKAETNCNRGIYRIALHRPVNRQLADLARKCKLAPVGRIGDRKKSKLSRQLSGCP